jgi:hypothetical protein
MCVCACARVSVRVRVREPDNSDVRIVLLGMPIVGQSLPVSNVGEVVAVPREPFLLVHLPQASRASVRRTEGQQNSHDLIIAMEHRVLKR